MIADSHDHDPGRRRRADRATAGRPSAYRGVDGRDARVRVAERDRGLRARRRRRVRARRARAPRTPASRSATRCGSRAPPAPRTYTLAGITEFGSGASLGRREPGAVHPAGGAAPDGQAGQARRDRHRRRGRDDAGAARAAPSRPRSAGNSTSEPGARRPTRTPATSRRASASSPPRCSSSPGIAVFVGGFLIFNTFSITVAQRVREFAMLRTLGASARQVLAAVLIEAALIGLLASAPGDRRRVRVRRADQGLFESFGFEPAASPICACSRRRSRSR